MSGSRTAIPIRAPSPTPYPSKTNDSGTTTTGGGSAHGETSTGGEWWPAEDLKGQEEGSSESSTASGQAMMSRTVTGPSPLASAQGARPATGSPARPSLSPTASLFQPSRLRTVAKTTSTDAQTPDNSSESLIETSTHGGFHYNHETYRTSPSPESFLYPVSTSAPFGVVEHVASTSVKTGSVSSVDTESSLLSIEEKAKIVELTSSSFARTSKAVAIRRPSETEGSSSSSQTLLRNESDLQEGPAGVSASTFGSDAGGGGLDLSAAPSDFRPPRPSILSSASSSHGSVTPEFASSAQLKRTSPSPSAHPPLSPTGASISSSRRSIFSNSLVPYGLSSDEEEESSTETEGSAPSFTTAEAGGGGRSDNEVSTSSTPLEQSTSQDRGSLEEGSSLEGAVREAMRSSDEIASKSPKTPPPPPPSSENVPTSETAQETTPSSADKTDRSSVQIDDTPDTSVSFVGGELHVESISEDVAGEKAAGKEAGAAQPVFISTGVAIVIGNDEAKPQTPLAASVADSTQASPGGGVDATADTSEPPLAEGGSKGEEISHADTARAEPSPQPPAPASEVETIRSEAVLRAEQEQARSRTTSGSTASEPAWHGMPQFNLDQRARATSFNPFAAPFVPPPALPAPFASQPPPPPPPPHVPAPSGLRVAFGAIGPLALPAGQPFVSAEIRYQTAAELLRQALHENGVLHHKLVKFDQVHKADHERIHQLTRELEELKQQNARISNGPRPDPIQQKQLFDLNQAISRQNSELARLQREREAARKATQQAIDERQAAAKRHEEEVAHENRKWKVALQMRDERMDALQAQVRLSEQAAARLKEERAAVAAASDARLEETKRTESDALAASHLQLSEVQQELRTVRARFDDTQAEAARVSEELRQSIDQRDEMERKLASLEKEREASQTQQADLERLRAEYADLQRRYDGQKEVIETQSRNLKEAIVQKEALQTSSDAKIAAAKKEEEEARTARQRFASMLRVTNQDKIETEHKYRAELDKVQRELDKVQQGMDALEKQFQDAVHDIIFLEGERDRANLVAAESYECAYSGMQSLRRLYDEEERRTAQLEADYSTLKTKCTEHIEHLTQQLKQREVEVERARKEAKNPVQEEALARTRRELAEMTRQRDEAVRKREEIASKYEEVAKELASTKKELEETRKARVDLQSGLKRMIELRDGHRNGEMRAQGEIARLNDQVKELERTQQATQQAFDEARSARKEAMQLHTESMAEALKLADEKNEVEEKMRALAEKVESLEADLEKAKSAVRRPFVSKTLSLVAPERLRAAGL